MDIKRIENATRRQVTFSKRRSSLIKKINETAVCCDIDAAFVAFSPSGRLSKFCSRNRIEDVLQRYITLPPEGIHHNIDHVEEKVKKLRHLSHIKGDENKLHYLNNKKKHMELQVKKSKIELEISEAELRNYEPDPTQDPSLAELEWCENHLKGCLQRMMDIKRMLLNNIPSSFSETPRFQMEMKNHQQSFPFENDYENHQTSDHNLGQHDSWINPSRHNTFDGAPQTQGGAPQDLQGHESIINKPTDLSFLSFPSVQESSVGALIPQGHAKGRHSDAPSFNVQLQGVTRDALMPFGITGQAYNSVSNNSMEQTLGTPTSHLPANVDNLFWQDGPHSSATDNLDCNSLPDTDNYPSFVNGNNDGHHAALYDKNPSPEKLEDLHFLNKHASENNSIDQTFGIPTSHVPANVDDLFWQNGRNFSANDNLDCNALVDPERNMYHSFVDGNNDGHHASLYHGNPSPEKLEDLHLLIKPTSENNSIEQTFGIPTSHVPANVDDLFWQNGRNFSANDNLDCNALVDPERNIFPSYVDGNNDGHHASLFHGNPSPEKQEDVYLLNKPTAEEQGNMALDSLQSIEENPENSSWEWDGYALATLLNSDKFETMF